jgi:hypothetical protein
LVARFFLRILAALFRDTHAVFLRCGGLSVAPALNVGGKWTNARPKAAALAN